MDRDMELENKCEMIFEKLADFSEFTGYDGWMIGTCMYEKTIVKAQEGSEVLRGFGKVQSELVKQAERFVVMQNSLETGGYRFTLELHVIKPGETKQEVAAGTNAMKGENGHVVAEHVFTKDEILRFVEQVKDENSIHRSQYPVVPGLLIAEWMLAHITENRNMEKVESVINRKYRFRFTNPVIAGETLYMYETEEKAQKVYYGMTEERGKTWSMRIL